MSKVLSISIEKKIKYMDYIIEENGRKIYSGHLPVHDEALPIQQMLKKLIAYSIKELFKKEAK